jgi:hypothetical protein
LRVLRAHEDQRRRVTDLQEKAREAAERLMEALREFLTLLEALYTKGQCPHGMGAKRRCKVCAAAYMRDYRNKDG